MSLSTLDDAALAAKLALEAGRLLNAVRQESGLVGKALGDKGDRDANRFLCDAIRAARPDD
jgi:3'(2'), 5'-bisphosphate nucleotidase